MRTIVSKPSFYVIALTLMMSFSFVVVNLSNAQIAAQTTLSDKPCEGGGGCCKLYRLDGTVKCEAICPVGKNPYCKEVGGCGCNEG